MGARVTAPTPLIEAMKRNLSHIAARMSGDFDGHALGPGERLPQALGASGAAAAVPDSVELTEGNVWLGAAVPDVAGPGHLRDDAAEPAEDVLGAEHPGQLPGPPRRSGVAPRTCQGR